MIVVTGGAGFIGSALIWGLNRNGISDILVVDNMGATDEKWRNLSGLQFYDYMQKDKFIECLPQISEIKTIFHMGACSSTMEQDMQYLLVNNFYYTKYLAAHAISKKIQFLYASSAATYGNGSNGFSDRHSNIAGLSPLNKYGFSKQLFDMWAVSNECLDFITGLKFFNIFGPNEYHKTNMQSFILKSWNIIKTEGVIHLFDDIENSNSDRYRDFLYIKDAIDMVLFLFERPDLHGIYNIGSGIGTTWEELSNYMIEGIDRSIPIKRITFPEDLKKSYQFQTKADISKLQSAGYTKPITPIKEAVKDYILNYIVGGKYLR